MISQDIRIEEKAAVRKKYLKCKILNLHERYIIIKNKKNLKNNIDFVNLIKFKSSNPSKYSSFAKLKLVEKKIIKKNKKIIFIEKSNLVVTTFDFK